MEHAGVGRWGEMKSLEYAVPKFSHSLNAKILAVKMGEPDIYLM